MSAESQENRTVEVLGVPEEVEEELLYLYFENKRRSGGGNLVSVALEGSRALLLFEEAEVASRVLSKRAHVLSNAELTVRKPACKDPRRLLLRGVNPSSCQELVELYVENMMGMDMDDYTLHPSPGRDLVLVHFHQAFNKDFQKLGSKISKKPLDGAQIVLEQIDQTDAILIENMHPSITADMLNLYLESQRGGRGEVKEVIMMSEGVARVSFLDFDSVERVLKQSHKLEETDLTVRPYFSFLQSEDSSSSPLTSPLTSVNGTSDSSTTNTQQTDSGGQSQTDSLPADITNDRSQCSHKAISEPLVPPLSPPVSQAAAAQEGMDDLISTPEPMSSHISVPDPVKLTLLQASPLPQSLQLAHQGCSVQIREDGVHMAGPDRLVLEQLKNAVLEFLGGVAQAHLTFDPEKAHFLAKQEVKDRLLQTLKENGLPSMYTVSDCVVMVTSLSPSLVSQACSMLKTLLSDFSIPVDRAYECMLYAQEWTGFLQSLGLCSANVSERGQIDVLTLRGLEEEKQAKIVEFLSTPIETEAIISMETGMLKYIQTHHHQLLADMNQVSIFPLDAHGVCGLRIQGNAAACQMADEVLRGVVLSTETRTITVKQTGVARFLIQEGEGTSILREMQTKFQVYINMEKVHWEPLDNEDIFEAAWDMTSHQSFQRSSLQASTSVLTHTIQTSNNLSASDRDRIEEAKRLFSAIDETLDSGLSGLTRTTDIEEDLYTAEEPMTLSSDQGPDSANVEVEEEPPLPLVEGGDADDEGATASVVTQDGELSRAMQLSTTLEEEAQMSLAIQYSMETTKRSLADEEEELQKVLELSRKMTKMTRDDGGAMPTASLPTAGSHLDQAVQVSLQEAIQSANSATIFVFAGYSCDLIRVDIALNKRVSIKQHEEKLEHRSLRNLSPYHRWCLDLIKRKHAVEVTIQGTTAIISGFKDFVTGAMPDMKLLLRRISTTTSDADILRTVQWVWHDPASSGTEIPYAPEATVFMENAWKMRQKKIDILLNNLPHIINFEKMQEYNVASGKSVTISRKMLSSDDMYSEMQDEDYSLLSNLPETSRMNKDSDEFRDVVKDFYDSTQEYHNEIRIIKVEKLMNRLLYNQYRLKKASINQSTTDPEVERTLYHGTSETSVKEICVHGFNRSFCGKNATVYGQGVYFAVNSALSIQDQYSPPNADGHKFVFVAKVLTGDFTQGSHSMKAAPLKESSDIPLRYDSVADKTDNPSLFVIFNDTQAYPEYLITCQKIPR
ncbi:protein mono-ADP-ribosyltransferase PARP10-like [Salvelinus sp. IW2-2015]|uniref:protein mono-ADP-ribosyltransferase PARP10-like n=1 Tax=Salvelinus sp. IW2-2015 TaxID=2691554 RepID=UPI000CDFB067|nr:poly [ADP-ribose] polymerase 10-like [Salvelinus alpinus]